jgi:DNA-binding transcriptional LysR family regulator
MLSMKLLEAYYWVARLRSFHAAADRLHITQPSISYRIKELENQLGRELMVRGPGSIRLTAQGQLLYGQAERMITAAQDLEQQFRKGGTLTGALRLGVTDAFAAICLPDLLRRMAIEHPELNIAVAVDNSHVLARMLDEGEVDLAVLSTPPMLPGLRYESLGFQRVAWVASRTIAAGLSHSAEWVAASRIFVTPAPSNLDTITQAWFGERGLPLPRLNVCNSMSAIFTLVQAGAGIGILPLRLVEEGVAAGVLQVLDAPCQLPPQAIFSAYSKGILDRALPRALGAVRDIVAERGFCT